MTNQPKKSGSVDIWRDTPLRLLGYANEVGESFRYMYPRLVAPSYVLAFSYVFADTQDKATKQYRSDGQQMTKRLVTSSLDCLIWQTLASVLIPGFVIHKVVKATTWATKGRFGPKGNLIPVFVGLFTIPFIVKPIDHGVDLLMDHTYRKLI